MTGSANAGPPEGYRIERGWLWPARDRACAALVFDVTGDLEIAYRVRGEAGAEGKVWLAARTAERTWISGGALEVGPGAFSAIVDLHLTGRPERYSVVLQVAGQRCADDAPRPPS